MSAAGPPRRLPGLPRPRNGLPVVRPTIQRFMGRVFGPPGFDPRRSPGDPGLLGPASASWPVIAEPAAIAGGVRGLLMQAAHPLAMAGVADHSGFRTDPLGRLQRTSSYVTATTFGSVAEALDMVEAVRRVHRHVRGTAPDGRAYRAEDPHLLAWVSVALTASFLAADRAWAPGPVTGATADGFVAEQSRLAALLDPRVALAPFRHEPAAQAAFRAGTVDLPMLTEGRLPLSVAGLDGILQAYRPELGVNDQGRDALAFLRWPAIPPPVLGPYLALYAGAVGSLEPWLRRVLELRVPRPVAALAVRNTGVVVGLLRTSTGPSPAYRAAQARAAA